VFVVHDADRFNESSANALLKTLEEPPAGLTFVLLAANVADVLPTILSRCQPVRFGALNPAQVEQISRSWENQPVNPDTRALLVRASQGSPGRLKRMLEYGTWNAVSGFLETVARDPFAAAEKLAESVHEAEENESRRERLREALGVLSAVLRDRLAGALVPQAAPLLARAAPGAGGPRNADTLLAALERLDDLRRRVDGNANLKLACDAVALQWPA
jgi:DNA polymerase-3 subunit delta'